MRAKVVMSVLVFVLGCEREAKKPAVPQNAREYAVMAAPLAEPTLVDDRAPDAPRSVVLVTIDGVRWQDVFKGSDRMLAWGTKLVNGPTMPRTMKIIAERGVSIGGGEDNCGVVMPANKTFVSLPGYQEILSGRVTTCQTNVCKRITSPSVLDVAAAHLVGPVASIGSWEMLERAATNGANDDGLFLSEGRTPADKRTSPLGAAMIAGERAKPFPGTGDYRPDENTEQVALAYLREQRPAFLHIGLGDTDEHGHHGDYAAYVGALRSADGFIVELADTLDEIGLDAAVIVTTDHGRSRWFRDHGPIFPESGRAFVLGFGSGVANTGATCAAHNVTLADVGATARELLDLPRDTEAGAGTPIGELLATH